MQITNNDNSTYTALYQDIVSRLGLANTQEREITNALADIQADIYAYSERLSELDSYMDNIAYADILGDY